MLQQIQMLMIPFSIFLVISTAYCVVCPPGYSQVKNGGDCFQVKTFYNSFATQYTPTSFDEAEASCSADGGGLLASIHSGEENDIIMKLPCSQMNRNIGLKCTGKECKWDDGSPMTYQRFFENGPSDDGKTRCYTMDGVGSTNGAWQSKNCGEQQSDCWVCRVKAKTIDCTDGETEYKGGCVSVQSSPLDQKTAEASCPGGGRLISIHSTTEKNFYKQLALDAGIVGSIFIGGHFPNGVFQWTDNSYTGVQSWANGFPNLVFGNCVQMLLDAEFGIQGQWTNIDCSVKQAYFCFRDGAVPDPTLPPQPKADVRCPQDQYYSGSGSIYSPNYPLSIPGQQSCEYVIGVMEGAKAIVKFLSYDCQSGTSLSLFDGLNGKQPFLTFTTDAPLLNQSYASSSNVLKMVFTANDTAAPVGKGWEAEYTGIL